MAIQHSTTISKLEVLNSGSEDTVCRVHVTVLSYDDSNMNETAIDSGESFDLSTEDRSSSSEGWVDFSSLQVRQVWQIGRSNTSFGVILKIWTSTRSLHRFCGMIAPVTDF